MFRNEAREEREEWRRRLDAMSEKIARLPRVSDYADEDCSGCGDGRAWVLLGASGYCPRCINLVLMPSYPVREMDGTRGGYLR